jgi:hypothetical protein
MTWNSRVLQNIVLAAAAAALIFGLVWLHRHPSFPAKSSVDTNTVLLWLVGGFMILAICATVGWFLWWKTGRIKWFVVGAITVRLVDGWRGSIDWLLLLLACAIFILAWRDDKLLQRRIDYEL